MRLSPARILAAALLGSACLWAWHAYAPLFQAPRSRLAPDAFYARMPPDASHIYLRLPLDHGDPARGSFKAFYILAPGFRKGEPVVFFLMDGQQPGVKPWLTGEDFREDFDPWMGGLSYVVIGGRGMEPTYFPEAYAAGRLDISEAMRLYGSAQYVEDIEAVRLDMASKGLLPRDGKVMLFGLSGAGVLVQQYLAKYGSRVRRAWLVSTGAPDLAARRGEPFNRTLEDFNPPAARLLAPALARSGVDARSLTWLVQRLGYRAADGRRRQVELLARLADGKRAPYWRLLLNPALNYRFMALAMRWLPEMDLAKVRIFELLGRDLRRIGEPDGGTGSDLMARAFDGILGDFLAAARAGRIASGMGDIDRSSFGGELLVLSGARDNVFSPQIGRMLAGAYRRSRFILVDDGHRMEGHRAFCSALARRFFRGGLASLREAGDGLASPPSPKS